MIEPQDREFVRQCLMGKVEAFGELIERYQKQVFNITYRMTNNYDESEEITQSVFVKAYEKLKMYNPRYRFFSWIYRIAVNETINYLNQRKRLETLDQDMISHENTPEQIFDKLELNEKIQDALMDIGFDYQGVVILRHFQHLPYRDIAYILDISEKTIKSRLFTARKLLKVALVKRGILRHDG